MYYFLILFFISISSFITLSTLFLIFLFKQWQTKKMVKIDVLYSFLWSAVYLGVFFLARNYDYNIIRGLFYYLGFLNFSFIAIALYGLIYLIQKLFKLKNCLSKKSVILFFIISPLIISAVAIYNFQKGISIEEIEIKSEKLTKEYRFLQVSDIQYGTVTKRYFDRVIKLITEQNVDFVVFTGDLVDFDQYSEEDLLVLNTIDVPVYFERGNHEFYHFPEKILATLEKTGNVDVLLNEKVSFGEIDVIGIDYQTDSDKYKELIKSIDINKNQFSVLLYHEPKNVEYSAELGFDLLLYGHTHGGQIWPFTELVDYIYTYGDGLHKIGQSHIYTSDGAALWGPRMRLGSQNEMVIFSVSPK